MKKLACRVPLFAAVAYFGLQAVALAATPRYTLVDLTPATSAFNGGLGVANAINDHGVVVGSGFVGSPGYVWNYDYATGTFTKTFGTAYTENAFAYQSNTSTLINLGRPDEGSKAFDINNSNRIVGQVGNGDNNARAFRSQFGPLDELPNEAGFIHPVYGSSTAWAISNNNTIVGTALTKTGKYEVYSYANDNFTTLGPLLGQPSRARDINDAGLIVGDSFTAVFGSVPGKPTPISGYIYNPATGEAFRIPNLAGADFGTNGAGGLFAYTSSAFGINNKNQVVGISQKPGSFYPETRGYLYDNGVLTELIPASGAATSQALAINDLTQIVGNSGFNASLWENGEVYNLNSLVDLPEGWRLECANDINNLGQIVGYMINQVTNQQHAFLLNPIDLVLVPSPQFSVASLAGTFSTLAISVPIADVPEPTATLFLAPVTIVGLRRSRR